MTDQLDDSISDELSSVLEEYLAAAESGCAPDPEEFLARYPALADDLRPSLVALDALGGREGRSADAHPSLAGRTLGEFRIERELGRGAMGTVYRARVDRETGGLETGATVALKVVHPHLFARRGFFRRFLREVEAGRDVRHENVVRTLFADATEARGRTVHFLVMEYVEGRTLRDLLGELGTVPEVLAREIARQVAAGLAAIHAAGIVHRDLKPENVLITDDHRVRIMDLGVARVVDDSVSLSEEGQFAGSLPYAAPEQFHGEGVGPAADLYSLGVLVYELVVGANPFRRDQPAAVMHAHLEHDPAPAEEVNPDVSLFLSGLLGELLAKDPSARPDSASAVCDALEDGEGSVWWAEREDVARAVRARRIRIPVRRETSVYGREEELGTLLEMWAGARDGKGCSLLVEGEAGIGKTRFVDTFVREHVEDDAHVLYGSYSPTGGAGGLSEAVLNQFGAAGFEDRLRPYLGAIPELVAPFCALLRRDFPPEDSGALPPGALATLFSRLMRGLAGETPLLWVVEDLHFADADSRKLVLSLARALEGRRILLLLTSRTGIAGEEIAQLARLGTYRHVRLGRLSPREVVQLLLDAFRSERLAEKLGVKIAYKSDGVPFFVFEMIRGLKEGQFITALPDGTWVETREIERIDVPSAVRELIEARLSGLSDEERSLLDIAAVSGFEFDPDLLARVKGVRRVEALQSLAAIERRSGIVRGRGDSCRFDHHQIQEVIYEDLMTGLREEYHSLLASVFGEREGADPERPEVLPGEAALFLAGHHLRGAQRERGLPYLDRALAHLEASFRNEALVDLADLALSAEGLLTGARRVGVLLRQIDRLRLIGRPEKEARALEEAGRSADEVGDDALRAQVARRLGSLHYSTSRYAEADEAFLRASELAGSVGDRVLEARTVSDLGLSCWQRGQHEAALEHYRAGRKLAREAGARLEEAYALDGAAATLIQTGDQEGARALVQEALDITREQGDRLRESYLVGSLGDTYRNQGRLEEARALYEQQLDLARRVGDRQQEMFAWMNLARTDLWLGHHDLAREEAERTLRLARELGHRRGEAGASQTLGNIGLSLARPREARRHFGNMLEISREIGQVSDEAAASGSLGLVCESLGLYAEAIESTEGALSIFRRVGEVTNEGIALLNLGRLYACTGQADRAVGALQAADGKLRDHRAGIELSLVIRETARLHEESRDLDSARDAYTEAVAIQRKSGYFEGVAESLTALARVEAARGRPEAAIRHLEEAVGLCEEHGFVQVRVFALCERSALEPELAAEASAALAEQDAGLGVRLAMLCHFRLWNATGDPAHLDAAHERLGHLRSHAPGECRDSMIENVSLHRDILAARGSTGPR